VEQNEITSFLEHIPPSQSDVLLREWGFDLLREYFEIALHIPSTNDPVLELATGTGRMCAVLSSLFSSVVSGDRSLQDLPRVLERVPKHTINRITFLQLDMEHLPFPDGQFRTAVCINTLHETEHPIVCLQELVRVTSPEGILVTGDFSPTGFQVMQKIHETVYHNDHEEGSISSAEIEQFLQRAFTSVRIIPTPLNVSFIASGKR
jgi:ubiquinone/menaquinone biosynthesis C-methylase UbiE